jgi:hypothetical protein
MEPQVSIHIQQRSRPAVDPRNPEHKSIPRKLSEEMIRRLLRDPVKVTTITAGVLVWLVVCL